MTALSTASTLGDSWNQRPSPSIEVRGATQQSGHLGAAVPPVWATAGLAADDLPRDRILIIADEKLVTLGLTRLLRDAGFPIAGPATTLAEVQRLIERDPIGCALLDLHVNRRAPLPIADLLAFADVPFVFMGNQTYLPREHAHRPVLKNPFDKAGLLAVLERAIRGGTNSANDCRQTATRDEVVWPRIFPSL